MSRPLHVIPHKNGQKAVSCILDCYWSSNGHFFEGHANEMDERGTMSHPSKTLLFSFVD